MTKTQKAIKEREKDWWKDKADPVPVECPADLKRPETMDDRIRRIIKEQISPMAEAEGAESFAEANDFDVKENDFDSEHVMTPYEMVDMQPEFPELGPPEEPGIKTEPGAEEPPVTVESVKKEIAESEPEEKKDV